VVNIWQRFQSIFVPAPRIDAVAKDELSIADPRVLSVAGRTFNPAYLVRSKGLREYDKMRRDDQVKAAMVFKKLAVLKSGWTIDSPEEYGDDWEVAQFVRNQFEKLPGTLNESLRSIMTALDYGFSVSEKVYTDVEGGPFAGKLGLKAIKTRAPHDIGFEVTAGGDILDMGITQNERTMPRAKFVVFSHEAEFGNPYGRSDLEAAYRAWFAKDNSYLWLMMGLERYGVDPIVATYNSSAIGKPVQDKMMTILKRMQAATVAVFPRGDKKEDIEFWQPQQSGPMVDAFAKVLAMFNQDIARALLMPGLLGFTADAAQGSLARSETHFEAFVLVIESLRRTLAEDVVQEQIIKQLVDLNYGPQEDYPKFTFLPLTGEQRGTLLNEWAALVAQGIVTPTEADEAHIREIVSFPERNPDDVTIVKPSPAPLAPLSAIAPNRPLPPNPAGDAPSLPPIPREGARAAFAERGTKGAATKTFARAPTAAESRIDFKALDASLEEKAVGWSKRLGSILDAFLSETEARIDKEFDGTVAAATDFELAFGDKLKDGVNKFLIDLYRSGRVDLKEELKGIPRVQAAFANELPNVDPADALAYLDAKALNISGVLEQRLIADAKQAMLAGVSAGENNLQIIERLREVFAPYVGATVAGDVVTPSRLETIVRTNLTDAYNQGRLVQGREAGEALKAWQYSAILDSRTTDVCKTLDGKVFEAGDPAINALKPPRHFNCRSILVPIVLGDEYNESDLVDGDIIAQAKSESGTGF
jgi:SPP1 gp7 family putative phage head morphogenesis protein